MTSEKQKARNHRRWLHLAGAGDAGLETIPTWVFTRTGTTWQQQGTKVVGTGSTGQSGQGGGVGISADGTWAVVGGSGDHSNDGAVWFFTR